MATNRRVSRVAELIKREVSQMLLNGIKDDRNGKLAKCCSTALRMTVWVQEWYAAQRH